MFCHTPHNATGQRPLWNRHLPPTHYRIYRSSTTDARIDQPSGTDKLCLGCHDGSLAIGLLASRGADDPVVMTTRRMPPGHADLTQDLSDDHPIGFVYDRALHRRDRQVKNPDLLTSMLPLGPHGKMQCTTCHDPHDNSLGAFLRVPQVRSAICLSCHEMDGWPISTHALSNSHVHARAVDPADPLPFSTIAENGCMSCHRIHSAPGRARLLRFRREEDNCLSCHNGSVARSNILSEVRKTSGHHVHRYQHQHDPNEDPRSMHRHVECVDCHNPHAVRAAWDTRNDALVAPVVSETMRYVAGVSRTGRVLASSTFEYEVCFKCHADGVSRSMRPGIVRQVAQTNTRLQFQTTNPSFHPVVGPRRNSDVVSLLPPWRVGSVITCTDCHNSDRADDLSPVAPTGPHGSIYEPILIDNYTTRDYTQESARAYALCYRCHDRDSILRDESFSLHEAHVVRGRTPCSVCHDAHGISRLQGNRSGHSNLINFDLSVVQAASGALGARIQYEDTGQYQGTCTLTCHGVTHVRFSYQP